VAGIVLGLLAALWLRLRGLRWTWASLVAPAGLLAWLVQWRAGLALWIAGALALYAGAYAHREALERGGEEAHRSRDAIGPLGLLRANLSELRAGRRRLDRGGFALGRTRRGTVCRVPLGSPGNGVHALILGATGAGKTVTTAALLEAHIAAGQGAIVLDPKGDEALSRTLADAAAAAGARLFTWSPHGPAVYNPIARGNPTEIADKCLAAHVWTEPHYRTATQRLLGHALATMRAAGLWPPTLSTLVAHMEPERLDALASTVDGPLAERTHDYVDGLDSRRTAELGGGRDRLAVLVESELGPRLDPALGEEEGEEIDLAACLDQGAVAHLRLDADRYPEASRLLAAALVIDLAALAAERQGGPAAAAVAIDEFGALAADHVSRLFARARGAGISLLLGTQSLADLRAARPEDASDTLTEQVLSNVSYTVAHRIADPDSAERLARIAGTEPAWTVTEKVGGGLLAGSRREGTRTRQRDFVVGPDEFKRLGTGEAIVIDPKASRRAEIVHVWTARPVVPAEGGLR